VVSYLYPQTWTFLSLFQMHSAKVLR
jgi:hypothetical protein